MLEIFIQHTKEDVESAIVQFVARRSYRLTKPWYLEGLRIEAPQLDKNDHSNRGFWSGMFETPVIPRIDVEPRRRRSGTRVRIVIANTPESTRLAYELHAYLLDERSYERAIPPICPRCSSPIANITARYCGRCGHRLAADANEPANRTNLPPLPAPIAEPSFATFTVPPVLIERDEPEMERSFDRPIADKQTEDHSEQESASAVEPETPVSPFVVESAPPAIDTADTNSENITETNRQSTPLASGVEEPMAEMESEAEATPDAEPEKSSGSPEAEADLPRIPERRNALAEE